MKCDNCIHSDVCANKNKLVQINECTWEEFAEIDDVENYCSAFKNKCSLEQVVEANNIIRDLKEKTINEFVEQFEELVGDSFLCANSVVGKAFDIVKDRMINGESEGV